MSFKVTDDPDDPATLKYICGTLTHRQRGTISTIDVVRIDRAHYRGGFLDFMDSRDTDLALLASELFDNSGNLRTWFYQNRVWKGNGCWGPEMDNGFLLYIKNVTASTSVRSVSRERGDDTINKYSHSIQIIYHFQRRLSIFFRRSMSEMATLSSLMWTRLRHLP
jgi:hypothetical protein